MGMTREEFKKVTSQRQIKDYKDATESVWVAIKARHAMHCKPRSPTDCVKARAIMSMPGVFACKVFRGITYIWWEKDDQPTRYQNSSAGAYFADLNDQKGRGGILEEIREEIKLNGAIRVELLVPSKTRSKAYLRSAKMKKIREKTAARRAYKDLQGVPHRSYKKPSTEGFRSGSGKALVWKI